MLRSGQVTFINWLKMVWQPLIQMYVIKFIYQTNTEIRVHEIWVYILYNFNCLPVYLFHEENKHYVQNNQSSLSLHSIVKSKMAPVAFSMKQEKARVSQ